MVEFFRSYAWGWPLMETAHFVGLTLLLGIVGFFDLRLLGLAKGLPVAPLRKLLPWGVFGFVLAVSSGLAFVFGVRANISIHPYEVLINDVFLQWKLVFLGLAGLNLFAFYKTGMSKAVDDLGPGDDAPPLAKVIAGASLVSWIGVVYFGRLIPWGQFSAQ
ncbi:MAG: hypothetical protein HY657_13945 [Acidobacteria bacterium]|nr:hypothetical protein [Acidobacteriota bacterium]